MTSFSALTPQVVYALVAMYVPPSHVRGTLAVKEYTEWQQLNSVYENFEGSILRGLARSYWRNGTKLGSCFIDLVILFRHGSTRTNVLMNLAQ